MTKDEFLQYSKSQVRYDEVLLDGYIELFKDLFGRKPNCAPCTFDNDYSRLKRELTKTDKIMAKDINQTFEVNPMYLNQIIRVGNDFVYFKNASDEQVVAYLSEKGKGVDTEARKNQFSKLPEGFGEENELSKLTVAELKDLAKEKEIEGYSTMKKSELIEVLS